MAEHVVTMWGGTGDKTGAVLIPGLVDKTTFDAGSASDFMGTDGEALAFATTRTVTTDTTDYFLTDTGAFTGLTLDGMYIYLSAGASGVGYYQIQDNTNDAVRFLSVGLDGAAAAAIGTSDHSYTIGGAGDMADSDTGELLALLDFIDTPCGAVSGNAINNLDILINQTTTLTATVDIDNISGSTATKVRGISCDSDFVRSDGALVIDTASAITALFEFFLESKYTQWYGFEFDGGDGSTDATHCIYNNEDASDYHVFENCEFHNATSHNVNVRGILSTATPGWQFLNCENHNAGGGTGTGSNGYNHTLAGRGKILVKEGSIHNCGGDGWEMNYTGARCENVLIYDNLENGLNLGASSAGCLVAANTIFSNTLSGILFFNATTRNNYTIYNNSFVDNTRYGLEFQADTPNVCVYLDYNHFDGNTLGEDDLTGDRPSMNDISGDPLFTSETPGVAGFLRPSSSSPLIDAGVGGTGDTIGALCAAAGGAGGGVMPLTGLLS